MLLQTAVHDEIMQCIHSRPYGTTAKISASEAGMPLEHVEILVSISYLTNVPAVSAPVISATWAADTKDHMDKAPSAARYSNRGGIVLTRMFRNCSHLELPWPFEDHGIICRHISRLFVLI